MRYRLMTTLLLALVLAVLYLLGDDADTAEAGASQNTGPIASPSAGPNHAAQILRDLVIP